MATLITRWLFYGWMLLVTANLVLGTINDAGTTKLLSGMLDIIDVSAEIDAQQNEQIRRLLLEQTNIVDAITHRYEREEVK